MPQVVGSHVIEVRAFNVDGQASDLTQISVTVLEGAAVAATPTLPPMTPTPTLTLFTPTPTVTPESLPQPTPVPTEKKPMVTALVGLNVRTGPSVNYPVLGLLAKGEFAEITGRDQFSGWWQIVFASAEGDRVCRRRVFNRHRCGERAGGRRAALARCACSCCYPY